MLKSNKFVNRTPRFNILSEDDKEEIYDASLEILQNTGVKVEHEEARSIFSGAGAKVEDNIVHLPPHLVNDAVSKAPKKVLMYDRNGELAMRLGGTNSYFGSGTDVPRTLDEDGEIRQTVAEDIAKWAKVCDALDNIDFSSPIGLLRKEKEHVQDILEAKQVMTNTTKPVMFCSWDERGTEDIFNMASVAVGGKEQLKAKPYIIHYIEPVTPLSHSKEVMAQTIFGAKNNLPTIYTPMPSAGAVSPMTFAGSIALGLAESLTGITLAQLVNEGAPMITGGIYSILDMQTSGFVYGGPEFALMNGAVAEMSNFLDLPMFGTAGVTDSKVVDTQAAIEASFNIATQSLVGSNLIHDVGYLSSGLLYSYDQLVMSDEIIGMVKRIMEGIDTSGDNIPLDLIDEVGPKGNFLNTSHTMDNFKEEHWQPSLMDRKNFDGWEADGSKTMGDRISEKRDDILENYEAPVLEDDKQEKIDEIIEEERENRKVEY
ncbi:trimethylamine methyltransferase family protein [Candidatus Bipolaricaulota bacterium]|nr:trimethylamine methyltransferase family protein [Candidatus Bipolaricaulota bacterium]